MMNPFMDPQVYQTAAAFYNKYYHDNQQRRLILGINPGRLGAGATGVPFTDPKRLTSLCGLPYEGKLLHEPSSVFVYEMITAFGGIREFYAQYYIHSVCPLGLVIKDEKGKEKNYNYYDSKPLQESLQEFIEWNIRLQLDMGCATDTCFCLGTGKNYQYLSALNERKKYFGRLIPLEHPRFIVQYKSRDKEKYITDYLRKLQS